MQTKESQEVTLRFFKAISILQQLRLIKSLNQFTKDYNINRWNLYKLKADPSRDMLQLAWLSRLVKDYNISAEWLLTGRGSIFKKIPKTI